MKNLIPAEVVENKIFLIRKRKVMLDMHLAELYGVSTKALNQAVKRNRDRFPSDFMFQLNESEAREISMSNRSQLVTSSLKANSSRSQFVTLKRGKNIKYFPYAFTEQGVAMLSSVLKSKRAVQVNIMIMRAFVKLREIMTTHIELAHKVDELEQKYSKHDKYIQAIFKIIKQLLEPSPEPVGLKSKKSSFGFRAK
jgi:hypothetical protein